LAFLTSTFRIQNSLSATIRRGGWWQGRAAAVAVNHRPAGTHAASEGEEDGEENGEF